MKDILLACAALWLVCWAAPRVAVLLRRIAVLLLALPLMAMADTTPVTTGPLAGKPKAKAAAKKTPVCVKMRGCCSYPCDCYDAEKGAWRECGAPSEETPPTETLAALPVERLTFDEIPVPEPEPEPIPEPLPAPAPPERGLRLALQAWTLAAFSGEADERYTVGGRLLADGPVAHAWSAPVRIFARLDISALPGQVLNFASVETFGRSAEFRGGAYVRLAESWPEGQHVTTSLIAWGGFATVLDGEVRDRYLRSGGLGVRLAEEDSGAELTVSWCRDEAQGYIGAGAACVSGSAPLPGTNGALVMGGTAVLNLSRASVTPQRDRFVLFVGASVGDIVSAVRGRR